MRLCGWLVVILAVSLAANGLAQSTQSTKGRVATPFATDSSEVSSRATGRERRRDPTNSALKQVGPGRFQIGRVTLDKESRSVTFPAIVNMTEAIVEYVVVTPFGKVHESLLRTQAAPLDIHLAMLLLDAKGSTNPVPEDALKPIPGDPVIIEVSWKDNNRERRARAEELILNTQLKTNLARGVWIYNGSRLENGAFMADREGSIVSLITDPFALVNNPRPGRDNDDLCEVNSKNVPPLDTAVEVRFILQRAGEKGE